MAGHEDEDEDDDLTDDELAALTALKAATGMIAYQFRVCPLCLTYNMANMIEAAEDRGVIRHWGDHGDPDEPERTPEEKAKTEAIVKKLCEVLQAFQTRGTKH